MESNTKMETTMTVEKKKNPSTTSRKPKTPKGAQDLLPNQMYLREQIFHKIRNIFKCHGGVEIETPVFELKETLTGKYGEDSKLIYDLADQGGELLALRYDLTVPFARFMATHSVGNIRRYQIARVYRRDNPQIARGRFREFYQCDFDIAGNFGEMIPDAEVISIGIEILKQFPEIGSFKVKLNHRRLLDAILEICGVPNDKFRSICSAIDKLDKEPWEIVAKEMITKGLMEESVDKIKTFVTKFGQPRELHQQLMNNQAFGDNIHAKEAMNELAKLFDCLEAMDVINYVSFDLSLARGLDYYTGLIYEYVLTGTSEVGSIAAGGRYDNLAGMFSQTGQQIPCVGISIGIERIFGILYANATKNKLIPKSTIQVFVANAGGDGSLCERLSICNLLWKANISCEITQVNKPKLAKQLRYALDNEIPFMIVIGEEEWKRNEVQIKIMATKETKLVKKEDMVQTLLESGCLTILQQQTKNLETTNDQSTSNIPPATLDSATIGK